MSFYDILLAKKLGSGGGGGDDNYAKLIDGSIVTANIPSGITKINMHAF